MSTKRRPQANEESYEALQALFLRNAEGEAELIDSHDIWLQVVSEPWFCAEVRLQASRILGGHVDDPLYDDLAQEALVQLKAKLSNKKDLGGDLEQLRTNFPGWMATIIHNACIDTLRRERRRPPDKAAKPIETDDPFPREDLRIDMAAAFDQLEEREREVALCRLHEMTPQETAKRLKLSVRQVERSLKQIFTFLKRVLAVDWNGR